MTENGRRNIWIAVPLATVLAFGGLMYRLGVTTTQISRNIQTLTRHLCRIEERQHLSTFRECLDDFTAEAATEGAILR